MIAALALVAAIILVALAVLHVAWASGRRPLPAAVIPTRPDGSPALAPGPAATIAVALLLLAAAFVLLERGGIGPGVLPPLVRTVGAAGVAGALLLRGIGDFRYVGLFKRQRSTPFGRMDTRLYTPLVLGLAALAGIVAVRGS